MKVKLLDLVKQYERIKGEVEDAIDGVLSSQRFILGQEVAGLEEEIAGYCGVRHAVGVASGSDAILLSLTALGVGRGDEVVTTPYTFFSTASSITRIGAVPVFADIDPRTCNIEPGGISGVFTEKTKAVVVVHLFGQMCDMDPIMQAANERKIPVIEDACQSIGALYRGKKSGSIGATGCFSFFPSKNLGGYGDGGMIVTDDDAVAENVRILRVHGCRERYFHDVVGINSRLDELQAAVLSVKLKYLDEWNLQRRENAAYYDERFSAIDAVGGPCTGAHNIHTYHQYVIRAPRRNELKAFLSENGIGTGIYYPIPLHLQKCFSYLKGKQGDHPESERAARETLALPVYPGLSRGEQGYVVEKIEEFMTGKRGGR